MIERNEQLIKEMENIKTQNLALREQVSKLETDLHDAHVCIPLLHYRAFI
jgi:cell division protein FtsB